MAVDLIVFVRHIPAIAVGRCGLWESKVQRAHLAGWRVFEQDQFHCIRKQHARRTLRPCLRHLRITVRDIASVTL